MESGISCARVGADASSAPEPSPPHQNTNAVGASHPDRIARGFLSCPCHRQWRNDRFSPTALRKECRVCRSRLPIRDLAIMHPQPLRRPTALSYSEEQEGEEAATPGQPVCACARFWNVLRRFTLENRRLSLALPQSLAGSGTPTSSLNPLLARLLRPGNTKHLPPCAEPVEDESSLWKDEEN
jgi:hypothetical protein